MAVAVAVASPSVSAGEPAPTQAESEPRLRVLRDDAPVTLRNAVWLEHRGSFRFRPELLLGGDLGAGESPVPAPIAARTGDDPDASTLSWASVRLRYTPVLHLGRTMSVHLGIDALDNMVLGSTHEHAGGAIAFDLFGDSAASPSAGQNSWRDAIRVRHLYARWLAFDALEFTVGRMPSQFGLGLNRHAGACDDCDFGTIVDAVKASLTFSGFRLDAAWEFTAVGKTTARPGELGQAKDLGQIDDVSTYVIQVGQRPVSAAEQAARQVDLDERRVWGVDWGVFTSFTDQARSSLEQRESTSLDCRPESVDAQGNPLQDYDCIQLYRRGAFFWRPGLWLRAELRPSFGTSLRLELEAGAVIGDIEHPQRLEEDDLDEAKSFLSGGAAFELEYRTPALALGLDMGFATGDDGEFVGVLDGQNIVDPDDDAYAQNEAIRGNDTISSHWFNRDYRLDLILFRQILGAVTNAVYFKPWVATDILQMEGATLTARLDVLYALAVRPSGTPGGGKHWGVEFDGRIGLRLTSGFEAQLGLGLLLPLDALDNRATGEGADPAFAAQGIVTWTF